jgi:hypothetical protein
LNLPNDIEFELLLRYVAELASPEEKLMVESEMMINSEVVQKIDRIQDVLFNLALIHAKMPKKSLKTSILQTIGKWEKRGTLWHNWNLN